MSRASLSRSFVCRLHSFPRWSFSISADSSLQENEIFDGQVEKIPYACTPVTTRGANPPEGALLTVWLKEFTGDEIKIEITNASGQPVANLKAPGAPGFTRLNWNLRPTKDVRIEYGGDDPKRLLPAGDYTAELSFGLLKTKQNFHVDLAEDSRRASSNPVAFGRRCQGRFFVSSNSSGPLKGQSNALANPNA